MSITIKEESREEVIVITLKGTEGWVINNSSMPRRDGNIVMSLKRLLPGDLGEPKRTA